MLSLKIECYQKFTKVTTKMITVRETATVKQVWWYMKVKFGWDGFLHYDGKRLSMKKRHLCDYGILSGSTLQLKYSLRTTPNYHKYAIRLLPTDQYVKIRLPPNITVKNLKFYIECKEKILVEHQHIQQGGFTWRWARIPQHQCTHSDLQKLEIYDTSKLCISHDYKLMKKFEKKQQPKPFCATIEPRLSSDSDSVGSNTDLVISKIEDEERRLRVYQKVIKAKHHVEICALIFNYLGLPRSGKTSFRRRIMGDIVNILQAGEIEQPSTGVAEDGGEVMLLSKTEMGVITESKVWTVLGEGDEANIISQLLLRIDHMHTTRDQMTPATTDAKFSIDAAESSMVVSDTVVSSVVLEHSRSLSSAESPLNSGSSLYSTTTSEDKEMLSILSDALESEVWDELKYVLDDLILITSNDAGGHAEFLDLHAALISGPSFNLFFSRLPDELDKVFEISYTNKKGESISEGSSTLTVEEVLFQALASIACFGCPYSEEETKQPVDIVSEKRKELSGDASSKVMFVCTHLDVIKDEKKREEAFSRKDKLLRNKLETTEFYQKDVIKYVSENQLMIKANNYNGDEKEIKNIQDILMKVISKSYNHKIKIPPSWFILSLHLRKKYFIVSLEKCQAIASMLKINPEDLQDALWFLHHCVGALLYYPEVEEMRDIVICKRQVVFDSASKLIQDTFTVEKVGHQRWTEFREKGQFSQKDLEQAVKEAAMEAKSDSLIPLEKLVSLFKHRNILTPTSDSLSPTYFMPCVLCSATKDMLRFRQGKTDPPSLFLCYDCGYTPLGIFPAIITNLVSQLRKDWKLIEEGLYRNRVQFHVGSDFDEVTLMSHPRYFEIAINRAKFLKVPTSTLCANVRNTVLSTLDEVTSNMNYHFNMKCSLAFECPDHPAREHLCVIAPGNELMLCYENSKKANPLQLEDHHKVWFPSTNLQDANVAGGSTDTSTDKMPSCILSCKDHGKVKEHLAKLGNQEIINIGVKLGIRYTRFKRMSCESLMDGMVESWLRKDDDISEISGDPSWKTLCTALKECGHTGIAEEIEGKDNNSKIHAQPKSSPEPCTVLGELVSCDPTASADEPSVIGTTTTATGEPSTISSECATVRPPAPRKAKLLRRRNAEQKLSNDAPKSRNANLTQKLNLSRTEVEAQHATQTSRLPSLAPSTECGHNSLFPLLVPHTECRHKSLFPLLVLPTEGTRSNEHKALGIRASSGLLPQIESSARLTGLPGRRTSCTSTLPANSSNCRMKAQNATQPGRLPPLAPPIESTKRNNHKALGSLLPPPTEGYKEQ